MNKYEEALASILTTDDDAWRGWDITEDIDTLQECIDKVEMYETFTIPNLRKILKILKTKGVDVLELQGCIDYSKFVNPLERYNQHLGSEKMKLTEEKFDLLKEIFE